MKQSKVTTAVTYLVLGLGSLLILFPLLLSVMTSFKSEAELMKNFFALPQGLYLENYKNILSRPDYYGAAANSFIITALGLAGILLVIPMASYAIARNMGRKPFYKYLYFFLLVGIFVPFQVKMMPLIQVMGKMSMLNIWGISIVYIASAVCEGVFLYVAYILSVPEDLEEAAYIDGAGTFYTYLHIVFPLLKPITATVLIRNGLWLWNDFFLPLLALNKSAKNWTLTLFQYNFKSTFTVDYALTFTTFVLSMLPIMVLYVFMQRHIIGGLTNGAVKG